MSVGGDVSKAVDGRPAVDARGISRAFRDFWGRPAVQAVAGLSLRIDPGEIFGLLGPNGSGKSTTLKLLLGLLRPDSGQVRVFGFSPQTRAVRARLGYLPEENYVYRHLTPDEILTFYGRLFNLPPRELRRRVAQLLEMTGLTHARRRMVGDFSKGMARRIGLAQALINDPDLVVLDEPTAGLDPLGCRQVKDLIRMLSRRGKTIVLSSHLLADVEDLCQRVAVMHHGRLVVHGDVRELLEDRTMCRLTFPARESTLPAAAAAAVREVTGAAPVLDHPCLTLEQFFLRELRNAGPAPGSQPSGVAASSGVAEYLRPPAEGILDRLAVPPAPPAETVPPPPRPESPEDDINRRLEHLA